jgi:hypothetical protein
MMMMKLRVALHTDRLEEVVAFYRDGAGFPETGRFSGHAGRGHSCQPVLACPRPGLRRPDGFQLLLVLRSRDSGPT